MSAIEIFREEVKKRLSDKQWGIEVKNAWRILDEFRKKFPYREKPDMIDEITPDEIYNPGKEGYFFHYIEHKLKPLGYIHVPSDKPWRAARENIETFKELLKTVVDKEKTLAEKIDAKWEVLKGWGGDKHYVKKLIFCYFSEEILPLFKTKHAEGFVEMLLGGEKYKDKANSYGMSYDDLTVGQKYEILMESLINIKKNLSDFKNLDNALFVKALYEIYPPSEQVTSDKFSQPLSAVRMLFSPDNEMGVVALFSMYHRELGFPYILRIQSAFPDATVIDDRGEIRNIEFKLFASSFRTSGYDPNRCDYIVCWYDDLPEDDDLKSKVLCLQEKLGSE
ncbi:MAG: hypothetical protein NC904_05135 [Candidatus Omnitrophica bacterium]|nr:hypothetical protein [Candidatus Omnitrophota bacterium]